MKILMLSEDPAVAVPGSGAHERVREYARVCGEMVAIVLTPDTVAHGGEVEHLRWYAAAAASPLMRRWRAFRIVGGICRHEKFDAMTVQSPHEMGLVMYYFARRYRTSLQVQVHMDIMSPWYGKSSWRGRMRSWLARLLLPRADGIRVVSERIARSLVALPLKISRARISVLPLATDISRFADAVPDPVTTRRFADFSFKVIAVGRFVEREKHLLLLIRAMARVIKKYPRALLVLVGAGPDEARYRRAIILHGLERHVLIEPWRADLPVFFKEFDCLALSSYFEGWGRVVVEAMASGLPIVMTDVGLAGEVVHDGREGLVVPVNDESAFAEALSTIAGNQALRLRMGARAKQTAREQTSTSHGAYLAEYRASFVKLITMRLKRTA